MIDLVKQILVYYFKHHKIPTTNDLNIEDKTLLKKKWSVFVTFYKSWEIRWAAWTVKELKNNIIEELIDNTISALKDDFRFEPIKKEEIKDLKIRVDIIKDRKILKNSKELENLSPVKKWIIVIKKDYSKLAIILPNIDHKLFSWKDYFPILTKKLDELFYPKDYIIYEIETEVFSDF